MGTQLDRSPGINGTDAWEGDSLYEIASIYSDLGDHERALELLEQSHAKHASSLYKLRIDQSFDDLHADSRFQDLVRRMDFPE